MNENITHLDVQLLTNIYCVAKYSDKHIITLKDVTKRASHPSVLVGNWMADRLLFLQFSNLVFTLAIIY